jgi:hypothetical protein
MNKWGMNPWCPKCSGLGWVWWNELKCYYGPAKETGIDDTRYTCDHECHEGIPENCLIVKDEVEV